MAARCCSAFRPGARSPYDRIVNAAREPGNWLTYSGNYQGHRFSPLSEITPANVGGPAREVGLPDGFPRRRSRRSWWTA